MSHTAIVNVSSRCNLQCVFCLEAHDRAAIASDPSTAQIVADLDSLYARGARHITFMGAETFFRKDLGELLVHARRLGFTRVGVTTNGTVLSKPGFLASSIASGLDFVEISIHGHTEALANAIAGTGFAYERQAAAMDEIRKAGLPAIVNVVVCGLNKQHLVKIAAYVKERLGSSLLRIKLKFVSAVGAAQDASDVAIAYSTVDAVRVGDAIAATGARYWFANFPLCVLGHHAARANELATLAYDDRYFHLDHETRRGYNDVEHQLAGHQWPEEACGQCTMRPLCPGLETVYLERHGHAELSPRGDDPCALVRDVLAERGIDPDLAPSRVESLRAARRLEVAKGAGKPSPVAPTRRPIRFTHASAPQPLEISVEHNAESEHAFKRTARFALSYWPWAVGDAYAHAGVAKLLEHLHHELERCDAAGMDIENSRAAISRAAADGGWLTSLAAAPIESRRSAR